MEIKNDEYYMSLALKEAKKAYDMNEVPVGCVIVCDGRVVAKAHNKREKLQQSIAHAEVLAIEKACKKINSWRIENSTIYVTLEPCVMCAGAIIQSRIPRLVYGAYDYRFGVHKSIINIFDVPFNHRVSVVSGIKEEECSNLIKDFFKNMRESKKEKD